MTTLDDRPRLRPLSGQRYDHDGRSFIVLEDPLGAFTDPVLIPLSGFQRVVRHFDGSTSLAEVQARVLRETGEAVSTEDLTALVDQLDRALVLDGPSFAAFLAAYRDQPVRPSALAGRSYPASAPALRSQLAGYFEAEGGSGPIRAEGRPASPLKAILSPHIDFTRGGPTYSWAYKELAERCDAEVFVILGVAHQYCRRRFALTRKDFDTPLGLVRADRDYVDRIAALAGPEFFDDELAHRSEHSVEFQAVFLKHALGEGRDFTIVPILAGSFHDLMTRGVAPIDDPEVGRFIAALRQAEDDSGKKVAYIGGIDLCHVGPEFGDAAAVGPEMLARLKSFDAAMLGHAASSDPAAWFGEAAAIQNGHRVCGLAATYTMLQAIGPETRGEVLKYDQAVDARGRCCVTFASVAFPPAEVAARA